MLWLLLRCSFLTDKIVRTVLISALLMARCFGQTPALVSIAVTSASPSIQVGSMEQMVAVGTYSDGSTALLTALAAWTSAAPRYLRVSSSGVATGVLIGRAVQVTAIVAGVSGYTSISVTAQSPQPTVVVTFECQFSVPGVCTIVHGLGTSTPGIFPPFVNSGCGSCYSIGNFTLNSFTVASTQAADLTFVILYAPPSGSLIQAVAN